MPAASAAAQTAGVRSVSVSRAKPYRIIILYAGSAGKKNAAFFRKRIVFHVLLVLCSRRVCGSFLLPRESRAPRRRPICGRSRETAPCRKRNSRPSGGCSTGGLDRTRIRASLRHAGRKDKKVSGRQRAVHTSIRTTTAAGSHTSSSFRLSIFHAAFSFMEKPPCCLSPKQEKGG